MFFFFPISTDAPVYHGPYATVGLIIANVVAFVAYLANLLPDGGANWMLAYGELNPVQWLLSAFMHADIFHLLGNMVFLWVFGLVVEGKLGASRFLACYLGIAVLESAVEQLLFLGATGGGSLGASTAVYGIMAMALVWAPSNEIGFAYFIWAIYPFFGNVEVAIVWVCFLYIGFDILGLILYHAVGPGMGSGSGWLHLAGLAIGLPLGVALLKLRAVDCEGWDIFHVWAGTTPNSITQKDADLKLMEERRRQTLSRKEQLRADAREQLGVYLNNGNGLAPLKLLDKLRDDHEIEIDLNEQELVVLIRLLHKAGKWRESAPHMARLIELRDGQQADPVRLKLAQICVVELGKPARALELINQLDPQALSADHRTLARKIAAKASQQQETCELELDDGRW